MENLKTPSIKQQVKLQSIITRPQVKMHHLVDAVPGLKELKESFGSLSTEIFELSEIQMKYEGYISKEQDMANKLQRLENLSLPSDFDYSKLGGLSSEAKEKLSEIKPASIGHASRISGVSPSDISIILIYLGR